MATESTEPDDAQHAAQAQTQNYHEEIVRTLTKDKATYKAFNEIPAGIFPCKFGTKAIDYSSASSFIMLFEAKKELNSDLLKIEFETLMSRVYPPDKHTLPIVIGKKWIHHPNWQESEFVYRATFGKSGRENSEIIQLFFCNKKNFQKFIDDFESLYFLKS